MIDYLERQVTHTMQDEHQEDDYQEEEGGLKAWLEDNLRIILSILVVFAIAGGIYSYSQRSQAPALTEETTTSSDEADQNAQPDDQLAQGETEKSDTSKTAPEMKKEDKPENPTAAKPAEVKPADTAKPAPTMTESKETETAFVETAARGDSMTLLARQATANFLEKNPDSAISREHKVYIEDYLRKHTVSGPVRVGTSVEFSKDLIREAIGKSKQLSDQQLTNLKKYSSRAPSLR